MARLLTSLFATTALVAAATPAFAQERAAEINVPAARLDQAIQILSRQSGVSIGFRDARLADVRVRPVRGRLTVAQALDRMLRGSDARARRVAAATFLIEAAQRPAPQPQPQPAEPRPAPQIAPPPPKEIVVTGTKRDIPLNVYPGGVQIIDGGSLSTAEGAQGTDAIISRVASVASTHLGPGRNKLFIRGIADSSFVGPTQATVGQYWGNSRITYSAPDPSLRLYDIRSIEVLEGPQGTLYGAGSLGGVVRVVPRAPDFSGFGGAAWGGIQAVQHGKPGVDGGAIVNVPLADDLAFRAVGFGAREGGYIDDTGRKLHDVNKVTTYGGRAGLRYAPSNGWLFDLNLVGQRIDGKDSQYAERGGNSLSRSSSVAQPYRNDYWLVDGVAVRSWDDYEFTASLGYARQNVFEQFDGVAVTNRGELITDLDGTVAGNADDTKIEYRPDFVFTDAGSVVLSPTAAAPTAGLTQTNRIRMLTAETRLAKRGPDGTGWLIGTSLLRNTADVKRHMDQLVFSIPLTGVKNKVAEATLYGEATFEPFDRVTVTFGGRLTHSTLSGRTEDVIAPLAYRIDPAARAERSETRLLPSAAIAYRANDRLTLFARVQQGFRPGGITARRDFVQRFKGDRVSTAEAGLRYGSRYFDIGFNSSLTKWSNIQADLIDGFGFPTTANVGDGRVVSLGITGRWRPLPGLELDASVYLNDTKVIQRFALQPIFILETTGAPATTGNLPDTSLLDFKRLPNIADVTGRAGFAYRRALNDHMNFEATGYARYVGKSTLGVGPILGQLQGNYVDTGMEFRLGSGGRSISLSLTNLLDTRGNRFALGSPFLIRDRNQITPLQPRTVRLGFDMAF